MSLEAYFKQTRALLKEHIQLFFSFKASQSKQQFFSDVIERLEKFSTEGKMLRGLLLLLSYEMSGQALKEDAFRMATAIEILHSALLIHDDIMDGDMVRRGNKTMFAQYIDEAKTHQAMNPMAYGQAMGICVGDIAFFLAFELLSQTSLEPILYNEILRKFTQEMQKVGAAQMADVHFGQTASEPTDKDIYEVYVHKTARYTFSLPLAIGAILSHAPAGTVEQLEIFGEKLGVLFQLKDDELGIFGSEMKIGKPIGSDIKENKKTILRLFLYKDVNQEERTFLDTSFGNAKLVPQDVERVKTLMQKYGIQEKIDQEVRQMLKEITLLIDRMQVSDEYKKLLHELTSYNLRRIK